MNDTLHGPDTPLKRNIDLVLGLVLSNAPTSCNNNNDFNVNVKISDVESSSSSTLTSG